MKVGLWIRWNCVKISLKHFLSHFCINFIIRYATTQAQKLFGLECRRSDNWNEQEWIITYSSEWHHTSHTHTHAHTHTHTHTNTLANTQVHRSGTTKYRVIRNDCRGFNNCHLVLQMQPHVISFYGVTTSRIRFMLLLFPQVSLNWRYESEPPLKPSPLTCYRQFGTNSIIVLMSVESQTVHIYSTCKVCNKNLECCSIK